MKKALLLPLLTSWSLLLSAQQQTDFYQAAMTYKKKENYTEACRQMLKAVEGNPDIKSYRNELAELQYLRRAYFEAIPLYEQMLLEDTENLSYLARLAEMYSMSPQKLKCVEYAERALKLKPTDGQINRMLGRSFLEVKHYPKAIACYLAAEKSLPQDLDIPFKLANCYREISRYGDAMRYFEKAVSLDPENANKLYEAANSCYDANYYKRACQLYQLAEDKGYYKSKSFYDNWAMTCTEMKDYDRALFYYAKAREYAPYDKDLAMAVADVHVRKGDFGKARDVLDQILELNPEDAEVIYTKGMTYYKAGNTGKAEGYFNRAFEIDPSLKSLRYTKVSY